jgi:uncharacterized protein YcbX
MTSHLSALHLYPVKSCAPLSVDHASVQARGLRHDRRWMVADAAGKFITGREVARLTLLRAVPHGDDGSLQLGAPDMPPLRLTPPASRERIAATVWKDAVNATIADPDSCAIWVNFTDSRLIGTPPP